MQINNETYRTYMKYFWKYIETLGFYFYIFSFYNCMWKVYNKPWKLACTFDIPLIWDIQSGLDQYLGL